MNILSPAGWLYGRIADLRNLLFDKDIFKSYSLEARTISIGNITAGGTGKTPLVAYVASLLAENGERVCILTRGYGREGPRQRVLVSDLESVLVDAKTGGDEPVELAVSLLGKAVVVADTDRISAARWAKDKFGVTAFVLDDAFQHRRAKRDVDIVCVDATDPFGNGEILPAGKLRERLSNLHRADAIVITRANLAENISKMRVAVSAFAPKAQLFEASNKIVEMIELSEFHGKTPIGSTSASLEAKFLAFCGIGNPSNFFKQLSFEGFDLAAKRSFRDHHYYRNEEIADLESLARENGSEALLTTGKDAVKLKEIEFAMPCFVVRTELAMDPAEDFRRLIISF